jgi:hypothetical protein
MTALLADAGRTAVFTRDMSWVGNPSEAMSLLEKKAEAGELVLFVGRETDLTRKLSSLSAEVISYESLGFIPKSRFTIVNHERAGERLAIGLGEDGKHVIREHTDHNREVLALATDLVELAKASGRRV